MMKNKVYEEFANKAFNKEENYEEIILKSEKNKKFTKRKILNIAAVFFVVILITVASNRIYAKIKWNIEFKEYEQREIVTGNAKIIEDEKNNYLEKVDMDYVTKDGVSIKVDNLAITDDSFRLEISFKFDENIEVPSHYFDFTYAVYDDENNVYGIFNRSDGKKVITYDAMLYKELGIKFNRFDFLENQINDGGGKGLIKSIPEEKKLIEEITMYSLEKGFPKSRKIFIRISNLGYNMSNIEEVDGKPKITDNEYFKLSDAEWIFEIEVPEKFYNREVTKLSLSEEIPEMEFTKLEISELGLVVRANYDKIEEFLEKQIDTQDPRVITNLEQNLLYLTDEEGNIYNYVASYLGKEKGIECKFDVSKKMLEKNLYINSLRDGKLYTAQLIEESK